MSNPFQQDYYDDAYIAGFDGWSAGEIQPPQEMPNDEREYWYRGYYQARDAENGDFDT